MWKPTRASLSKSCEEAGSEWQGSESSSEDGRAVLVGLAAAWWLPPAPTHAFNESSVSTTA
eukprot:1685171-Lingulodinium_polyedra.AAC.1